MYRRPLSILLLAFAVIAASSASSVSAATPGGWSPTGSMTTPRVGHTMTLLTTGKVLVAGGETSAGVLGTAELYDPATGTWARTGSMVNATSVQAAVLLPSGKVLVAGGDGRGSGAELELDGVDGRRQK